MFGFGAVGEFTYCESAHVIVGPYVVEAMDVYLAGMEAGDVYLPEMTGEGFLPEAVGQIKDE